MSTTNILDLNNRIDALEKFAHNVEPIQQQIDELKAWTDSGTKDASGNPIILTDGAAFNAVDLKVSFEPKQSGSGTPSPENVRPITGYTECVVDRDGRNLLAGVESGAIDTTTGQDTLGEGTYRSIGYIKVSAGSYTVSHFVNNTSNVVRFFKYDANKNYLGSEAILGSMAITLGVDSSVAFIRFQGNVASFTDIYPPQVEQGNTATPYVPYSHANAAITFGQTVYGGSVDFKTGKVTVTHGYRVFDGDEYWQSGASVGTNFRMVCNMNDVVQTGQVNAISNELEYINNYSLDSSHYYIYNGKVYVFLPASNETDFKAWLASNPLQVCYPLATPTELTLTPAKLELLKGYNYISTNGDNIELTYQPDNLKADIILTVYQLYGSKISIFDGILTGGDTGQVLTKTSDDNYDATWETLPATRTTTRKSEK